MAEEIHVDPATYSKFEGHIARPGIDIASQIERVTEGAVRASYWEDSKP